MSIYLYSGAAAAGLRQSEGIGGDDYGHFARRQTWTNSSNLVICSWALGNHQDSSFIMHFGWTDWCCNSGGGGMLTGTAASGYGTPGSLSEYNMVYDAHSFNLYADSYTIRLRCTGGNGNGPSNVFIGVSTTRSDVFSWGA